VSFPTPHATRRDSLSRPARVWVALGLAYALLAVGSTWPLARMLTTHVSLGSEAAVTAPMLNVWLTWWNADRLRHGLAGYWDAPIYHPEPAALASSEPLPTTMLVAPFVWGAETPVTAYNLYLRLSLALNGWFGARLLMTVHGRLVPAALGGAMLEMLPFVHWQLGVSQLVPLWGVLWLLQAVWKFGERATWRTALATGAAFATTYLSCNYYGLFAAILLVPCAPFLLGPRIREPRSGALLLAGVGLAALLLSPVLVVQLRASQSQEWAGGHDDDLVRALSAEAADYTAEPWPGLLPLGDLAADDRRHVIPLSPGNVKYALALAGLLAGLASQRSRRWTAFCITWTVLALLLSMGPRLRVGTFVPYAELVAAVPVLASVRSLFRAAAFVQLGTVLLAVGGLVALGGVVAVSFARLRNLEERHRQRVGHAVAVGVMVAIGGCGVLEVVRPNPRAFRVPDVASQAGWIDWLRSHTEPTDAVVAIPFTIGGAAENYQQTVLAMYWGIFHERPLANGYSTFAPPRFQQLMDVMYNDFPGARSMRALHERGVRYLIVRREDLGTARSERLERSPQVERVFSDDAADVDLYRLKRAAGAR